MDSNTREMPDKSSFGEFSDKKHEKLVTLFSLSIICCLILAGTLSFLVFTQKDSLFLGVPITYERDLFEDVCFNGFHSIVNKNVQKVFVLSQMADSLIESNYKDVDFDPSSQDYRLIRKVNGNNCRIVIKSKNDRGINLRSFLVSLQKNNEYPFEYKVSDVSETFLEESDRSL